MWALEYASLMGLPDCQTAPAAPNCDADEDGVIGETCTANEMLWEVWEDPLGGELADTDGDGVVDAYPKDVAPAAGDGNLIAVPVPACADGTDDCPGQELHCVDGTRPLYYVDPADDLESTDWLITFQGGGGCGRGGLASGGEDCWQKYSDMSVRPQMTTFRIDGGLRGVRRTLSEPGIHGMSPSNTFSSYHRIKIDKCTYDRGTGTVLRTDLHGAACPAGKDCSNREDDPDTDGKPTNLADDAFNLPFHGWFVVEAVLADLADGEAITDWPAETDPETKIELPRMDAATRILVGGHSGGAFGMVYNLDRIASVVGAWGGSTAVYGVFDAKAWPGIDHEEGLSAGGGDDLYDHNTGPVDCTNPPETCLPLDRNGLLSDYSDAVYRPGGQTRITADYRGAVPDDSCVTHHVGPGRCYEPLHVLYNHTSTPFFARQALRDQSHLGKAPAWAHDLDYRWDPSDFTARVVDQVDTFEAERAAAPGRYCEAVYGWANAVGIGLFYPDTRIHAGLYHHGQFMDYALDDGAGCTSYHDALKAWLDGLGDQVLIEGAGASACP